MFRFHRPSLVGLVVLGMLFAHVAMAGNRPQMIEDAGLIADWIGKSAGRLSKEATDGVIATRFRRVEISNDSSTWILKVDCNQKQRPVRDILGKHRYNQPYDEPQPHGFYVRVERHYSEARPEPKLESPAWAAREDGTLESRTTLVPAESPQLWLTVYCHRGSAVSKDEAAVIDALLKSLRALFPVTKAEQAGVGQPATASESKSEGEDKPQPKSTPAPR